MARKRRVVQTEGQTRRKWTASQADQEVDIEFVAKVDAVRGDRRIAISRVSFGILHAAERSSPGTISLYQTECGLGFFTAAPAADDVDAAATVELGRGGPSGEAGGVGRGRMWVIWTFRDGYKGFW